MTDQSTEVDVNVLIKIYNNKISSLTNQNLLLEAKLHTLTQDFQETCRVTRQIRQVII